MNVFQLYTYNLLFEIHLFNFHTYHLCKGIVAAEGQQWSEQRRFALRHLRDFGFGKKSMEGCIQDDATDLINGFLKDAGKSISTNRRLQMIVLNSLWNIIAGEKFAQNDPRFQSVLDQLQA